MFSKYLFDTPSIITLLKFNRIDLLYNQYIQELTLYEIGSILWKEVYMLKKINLDDALKILDIIKKLTNYMNVLSIKGLEDEILKIAYETKLTFYDASYIILSKSYGLTLVTDDEKLRSVGLKYVKVLNIYELLRT